MNKKQVIRINENQLRQIVKNTINEVWKQHWYGEESPNLIDYHKNSVDFSKSFIFILKQIYQKIDDIVETFHDMDEPLPNEYKKLFDYVTKAQGWIVDSLELAEKMAGIYTEA
jgi:hypothetical protein